MSPLHPARWRPGWRGGAGGGPANICFYGTNHLSWLTTAAGRGGAGGRGRHLLHAAWVLTIPGALSISNYTDKPTFQYPQLAIIFLILTREFFISRQASPFSTKRGPSWNRQRHCPLKIRGSGFPKVLMSKLRSSHERWCSCARCLSAVTRPGCVGTQERGWERLWWPVPRLGGIS